MVGIDYLKIAKTIVNTCVKVQPGENVVIYGREDTLHLCDLIGSECYRLGAFPFITVRSDLLLLHQLLDSPFDSLRQTPTHELSLVEDSDVIIVTYTQPKNPSILGKVPQQRISARRLGFKPIADQTSPQHGKRWLLIGYPTQEQASVYGINFMEFFNTLEGSGY
jgi:leucyl aminopeptidase (aminopeptidase T)